MCIRDRFKGFRPASGGGPGQWVPVRHGVPAALLAALLLVSGCSDDDPEPAPVAAASTGTAASPYDATLEPSAAVLALVPEDAETLTVTDFDQVRLELGLGDLTDQSPAA